MVTSPTAVGPENDCPGEGQQPLQTTDPSSRQRGYYLRTMKANIQLEKIAGLEFQGAYRGKSPVVK
jgi:hypothetical protein